MGRRPYTVKSCGVSNVPMERLVQLQPPLNGHGDDDDGDAATLVVVVDVPKQIYYRIIIIIDCRGRE